MPAEIFDLIIVGTGPAGMTAAVYAQRLGLRAVVFGDIPGGALYMVERLTNFPGMVEPITGMEFGMRLFQQASVEGACFTMSRVRQLGQDRNLFLAVDDKDRSYAASAAIVATGHAPIRLPGEHPSLSGVHFCSVCDGPLYRNQKATLAVVGSDNTAVQHAATLARIAEKVILVFRSAAPLMDAAHAALLKKQQKIATFADSEVVGFRGEKDLQALLVKQKGGPAREMAVDGVFLAIGWRPHLDCLDLRLEKSTDGYLVTDANLMTSHPGLFAAGDVRASNLRQVLTSCADGARAAKSASVRLR